MIKIGYLLSYDYKFLMTSLKLVYNHVDKIVIAVDINYKTWSGNDFIIPQLFFDELLIFDIENKIEIYRDNFYIKELSSMECDTRERNMLSEKLGEGWKIQLDSDEYLYNFDVLIGFLKSISFLSNSKIPISFKGSWITLFKKTANGYLYIDNEEPFPFVTNKDEYSVARNTENTLVFNLKIKTIHQSWARSKAEIEEKLHNWGHKNDFDVLKYLNFWDTVNSDNYAGAKNFHPVYPNDWPCLKYLEAQNINEFIEKYSSLNPQVLFFSKRKFIKSVLKFYIKKIGRVLRLNK
jgi:hypothetical protein